MRRLSEYRRILVLTEGRLGVFTSKTAACLLRYRSDDIVGIIDSRAAGGDVRDFIPFAAPCPIFAQVVDAAPLRPEALFVGVAPVGGSLPVEMRVHLLNALRAGLDVVSGLHERLSADLELASVARARGAAINDLRTPPAELPIAAARAAGTRCRRVLTIGTDCNVGKMVTAMELALAARARGLIARFVATGQTGMMIADSGIAIDAVPADFVAGAAERLVLENAACDVCFIEGQGSILHPGFSAVSLGLLHGCCPDAMILVHHTGRTSYRAEPYGAIPPLREIVDAHERMAAFLHPARVVGVALNTAGASDAEAAECRRGIESELNLPVADPLRDGCEALLDALGIRAGGIASGGQAPIT